MRSDTAKTLVSGPVFLLHTIKSSMAGSVTFILCRVYKTLYCYVDFSPLTYKLCSELNKTDNPKRNWVGEVGRGEGLCA